MKSILDASVTIVMLVASSLLIWRLMLPPPSQTPSAEADLNVPTEPFRISPDYARLGNPSAPVVIIEFSDFQCPFCKAFAEETLPELKRTQVAAGRVQFAYRHFPLNIHPQAKAAAAGADCAGRQGSFWPMHDLIYRRPKELSPAVLTSYATQLNLDIRDFDRCSSSEGVALVNADVEQARSLAIRATPTFFIGTLIAPNTVRLARRLTGMIQRADLAKEIEMVTRKTETKGAQ